MNASKIIIIIISMGVTILLERFVKTVFQLQRCEEGWRSLVMWKRAGGEC